MDDTILCPNCGHQSTWLSKCERCYTDLTATPLPGDSRPEVDDPSEAVTQRIGGDTEPMPTARARALGFEHRRNSPRAQESRSRHRKERIRWHSLFWGSSALLWLICVLGLPTSDTWTTGDSIGAAFVGVACWWGFILACYVIFDSRGTYFEEPGWIAHVNDGDWLHGGQCPDPSWHWTSARRGRRHHDGSTDYSRNNGVPSGGMGPMASDSSGAGIGNGL